MSLKTTSGQVNQKLHSLVLVWIGLIVLISMVIFVAFAFYTQPAPEPTESVVITNVANVGNGVAAAVSATPLPATLSEDEFFEFSGRPTDYPTPLATVPPVLNREFDLGIHVQQLKPGVDEAVMGGYLDAAASQLQLNWVRVEMQWDTVEPEPDVYDWVAWDAFFRLAVEHDLKVLVMLMGSPAWARGVGADLALQGPPADYAQFADFVTSLLRRYPNQIHALEIWNDMNFRQQWDSPDGLNGAAYVEMLRQIAVPVRLIDPNIVLISGGLAPTGWSDGISVMADFSYMDSMIAAGLLDVVDCVGAHQSGYNIAPHVVWDNVPADAAASYRGPFENPHPSWSFYSTLTTYANKIAVAGYDKPICITEFGWAVADDLDGYAEGFEFALDNTLQEQRDWLIEAIHLMQDWEFVWLAFIWNLNSGPEAAFDGSDARVAYSLIRPNYALSPAWLAIAEMDFRSHTGS